MASHKPGKCAACGGKTGSISAVQCRTCYDKRGREFQSQRSGVVTDGLRVDGDRAELVTTVDTPVRTLEDLIRVCKIDTAEWEIVSWRANKWEMAAKDDTTQKLVTRPLFQVTANMKRRVDFVRSRREIEALVADAKKQIAPRPAPKVRAPQGEHMLELSLPDVHLGKLAWPPESMGAAYDLQIAVGLYKDAFETLISRVSAFRFARILIPFGNDFLHSDNKAGTTTSGTPLDMDSRFHKNYVAGRNLMIWAIERARQLAPIVTVVSVFGNHDNISTFCIADGLECWYHSTPGVEILNAPSPRKYIQHGKCMILFAHGDKGKQDNYPLLMATERPQMFGETVHREAHLGHRHILQVKEHMGVRVRIIPSLSAPDAWHSEQGFVGSKRGAEGFVWNPEEGLVSLATYTVREPRGAE